MKPNPTDTAFRALFLKAARDGEVAIPCDDNRAMVLRMQLYNYIKRTRKNVSPEPDLIEAFDSVSLSLRKGEGLTVIRKDRLVNHQLILDAIGGEEALQETPAPKGDADAEASLNRIMGLVKPAPIVEVQPGEFHNPGTPNKYFRREE